MKEERIAPKTSIAELAQHPVLDKLIGPELVIYIRLIGETSRQGSRKIIVPNASLFRVADRVAPALKKLIELELIRVSYDPTARTARRRTIEVCR